MKKMFVSLMMVMCLVFAGNVMAGGQCPNPPCYVEGSGIVWGGANTGWYGNGVGYPGSGAYAEGQADADAVAESEGSKSAYQFIDANAHAYNPKLGKGSIGPGWTMFGPTAIVGGYAEGAYSGMTVESDALAIGKGKGSWGDWADADVWVSGQVNQGSGAEAFSPKGLAGADAGQQSHSSYYGYTDGIDFYGWKSEKEIASIHGTATTFGASGAGAAEFYTKNGFGSVAVAATGSMGYNDVTRFGYPGYESGHVSGSGGVRHFTNANPGTYTSGNAQYQYQGGNFGAGAAITGGMSVHYQDATGVHSKATAFGAAGGCVSCDNQGRLVD